MLCCLAVNGAAAQQQIARQAEDSPATRSDSAEAAQPAAPSSRFLNGRSLGQSSSASVAVATGRAVHAAMVEANVARARTSPLSASWQAVGPSQVASLRFGTLTGRVSSIAIDPADTSGNTVYLGTTGGGVWKSTNAAGPSASVSFAPMTDSLPVFSGNAGSSVTPSLSIGALSVQGGVILAGTGDPNDALDSYYGSGILRSTDGGLTWSLIQGSNDGVTGQHMFTGLGFAGFAWSSLSPQLVVAAVSQAAEGVLVNASADLYSTMGLYYSTDAGATWRMATLMDGSQTVQAPMTAGGNQGGAAATAVVWNPVRQRFYAAVRYHGYYESSDGVTWTRLSSQPGTGLTQAACPSSLPRGSTGCPLYRGALAVQPDTGDLFALTTDRYNTDRGLWQDVCAKRSSACASASPAFATQLNSAALEAGGGSTAIPQADYNMSLAAVPQGSDTVLLVGTVDLYRCTLAGGCSLRNTTNAVNGCASPAHVAPSQHALAATSSGSMLLLGNDGGLWRSSDLAAEAGAVCSADDATHFDNLNGGLGSLAEVLSFAQDPEDATGLLVGLGAAGSAMSSATSGTAWPQMSSGEGARVAIDPSQPGLRYVSTAAGVSIRRCSSGAACTATEFTGAPDVGAAQVGGDLALLEGPWMLDPALPGNVLVGTCRVWRGPAASSGAWSTGNAISAIFAGPQGSTCDGVSNPFARSIGVGGQVSNATSGANAGSEVIYAGMAGALDGGGAWGGHVFATYAGQNASRTTAWTDVALSTVRNDTANAGRFNAGGFDISSVAVDPHDATGKTVYVTVMGFSGNGLSTPHVYGSTDGGAHWTNLSSNLPDAPATSVVVDPNDANTVYLAGDTGVYVTTQITSCSTTNCWSAYGAGLPNAPVVQIEAAAGVPTGDGRVGELRAGTYGRGMWQIPLLTAAYPAQPAMALSPAMLTFADQSAGTTSAAQSVTVTNTGAAALRVSRIAAAGDFLSTDSCVGAAVAPGASCTISVTFAPTAAGTRAGLLTVYANVSGGQATVVLSGTATVSAKVVLTPSTLNFADTVVNATSAAQNVTISNLGNGPATLTAPVVAGDFRLRANTCGLTLAPKTGCTVSVAFSPTISGARTGALTVGGSEGTLSATMSGRGTLPATDALSTLAVSFGTQTITGPSQTQQIVLTNNGDVALTLIDAQISIGEFAVANFCGNSLAAHSNCAIAVSYVPKSIGPVAGTLTVSDQFRSQAVSLSGVGVAPPGVSLLPSGGLAFGGVPVGANSAAQTLTLTNNGGTTLHVGSLATAGDFAIGSGTTCGATLAPGTSCALPVVFHPVAPGSRTGTLTLVDDAPGSPHVIPLGGAGVDFVLAADGGTTASVASGKNATYAVLLTSAAGVPGTASLSCAGAPNNATCSVNPANAPLGSTTVLAVTVNTGVSSSTTAAVTRPGRQPGVILLGVLLPGALMLARRRRLASVLAGMIVLCSVGCGAGRAIPVSGAGSTTTPTVSVTPAGTYPITVTATSAGLSRTLTMSLTVK